MCIQVGHRAAEVEETQHGHGTAASGAAGGETGGEACGAETQEYVPSDDDE
jgi:hypothetical protein